MALILGTAGDDTLNGTTESDVIAGFEGSDLLFDGGGSGADELNGGNGDDFYYVNNRHHTIVEYAGGGEDWVYTTALIYVLTNYVEKLTYTGSFSFVGIGNDLDNFIAGSTASDAIAGGAGNDIINGGTGAANELIGGDGDDAYFSFAVGDTIVEYADGGFDGVATELSRFTLAANVEGLTFYATSRVVGVGNDGYNNISANTAFGTLAGLGGNDTLQGGTGGASELIGGTGDDTFYVVNSGDSVIEFAGEGVDTVQVYATTSAVTIYTLPDNVENLTFIGAVITTTPDYAGVGNSGNNRITGANGNDVLSGLDGNDILEGGNGSDLLIGGNGADQFRYFGVTAGLDRIIDFESGVDKMAFANFTPPAMVSFVAGTAPVSTNFTFLYDPSTGIVSADFDGTGSQAAVQFAQLNTGLTLSVSDFIFV